MVNQTSNRTSASTEANYPDFDAPRPARSERTLGRITCSADKNASDAWLSALLLTCAVVPMAIVSYSNHPLANRNYGELAVLGIFLAAALGLNIRAIRWSCLNVSYGESVLELAATPVAIGGVLKGKVTVRKAPPRTVAVKVCLSCCTVTGSGNDRSVDEFWRHEEATVMEDGTVPLSILIPAGSLATKETNPADSIFWALRVESRDPGTRLYARFAVPVSRLELTADEQQEAKKLEARERKEAENYLQPRSSRIRVQPSPSGNGIEIILPAGRSPGVVFSLCLFALAFGTFASVCAVCGHGGGSWVGAAVPGLVALFLLYVALVRALSSGVVEVNAEEITQTYSVPWQTNQKKISVADIRDVMVVVGAQVGSTTYYSVKIVPKNDNDETFRFGVSSRVKDEHEAQWLAAEIKKAAGL